MRYAVVVVDVRSLRSPGFHYLVPPELAPRARPGTRVLVPLGRREVTGMVVGLDDRAPVAETRPIRRVLDDEPVLNAELLELAMAVARYYGAAPAAVFWSMLPASVRYRGRRVYTPAAGGAAPPADLPEPAAELLEALAANGALTAEEAVERCGPEARGYLAALRDRGLVQVKTVLDPGTRFRSQNLLVLGVEPGEALAQAAAMERRAPRRAAVLRELVQNGGRLPSSGLPAGARAALVALGLARCEQEVQRRCPQPGSPATSTPPVPTGEQQIVLQSMRAARRQGQRVFLLHGVTGSGKTEVYLRTIAETLAAGRQAIVLVPEIALTPQTLGRFQARFGDSVAVLHSALSMGERYDEWHRVRSGEARVVVGARSAVFAPVSSLGAIIVDEEHETSYKQDESPRYHARDVALLRARGSDALVLLGSATPSLESYWRAQRGDYGLLKLARRVDGSEPPPVELVDMRTELRAGHRSMFSRPLLGALAGVLQRRARAILFLNRRGFAAFLLCRECGLVIKCPQCDVSLTLHAEGLELQCHYCGFRQPAPDTCPACQSRYLRAFGVGTERVESEVGRQFPTARVLRMDADTTSRRGAHQRILEEFARTPGAVLVGTQMIAKGLDIAGVELVGVVTADTALNFPDFRSAERTFQLLTQVAGRSGRGGPGRVLVQTYHPEHYAVQAAAHHDYQAFAQRELDERRRADFPPYAELVRLLFQGPSLAGTAAAATAALPGPPSGVRVLGPAPAPLARLHGHYRYQVLLAGADRGRLLETGLEVQRRHVRSGVRGVRVQLDPDPSSML